MYTYDIMDSTISTEIASEKKLILKRERERERERELRYFKINYELKSTNEIINLIRSFMLILTLSDGLMAPSCVHSLFQKEVKY